MKTVVTTTTVVFTKDFKNPYSIPAGTEILLSDKVADKLIKLGYAVAVANVTITFGGKAGSGKSNKTAFIEDKPSIAQPE